MSYLIDEIASQPECWSKAIEMAGSAGSALPGLGERVAAIGCGSSLNVARCYAALREAAGQGETDAFPASEVPAAGREVARPLPPELAERSEFTFLGRGWAAAVADEAALKLREASRTWAESYPAMEYRHGPISVRDENTVVWALGEVPAELLADARHTGATVITSDADPLVALIGAQRLAAALAERKGIDPDQPRALSRSVILAC